jgi:hypothetical protein
MAKRNQKIELWAGDTPTIHIRLFDEQDQPAQLGDPSAIWSVRRTAKPDSEIIVSRSEDDLSFVFYDGFWHLVIQMAEEDTLNMAPGVYYHEATVFDGDVRATTTVGPFAVLATANRRPSED